MYHSGRVSPNLSRYRLDCATSAASTSALRGTVHGMPYVAHPPNQTDVFLVMPIREWGDKWQGKCLWHTQRGTITISGDSMWSP
jgi:hypothetical protein